MNNFSDFNLDHNFGLPQLNEHDQVAFKQNTINQIKRSHKLLSEKVPACVQMFPAMGSGLVWRSNAALKDSYTTKFKCLAHQKAKSLSLKADHYLLFGNTLAVVQVMLTKNTLYANSAVELCL